MTRSKTSPQSLESVLDQQDVELEVIVVNDHSSDRTGPIADAHGGRRSAGEGDSRPRAAAGLAGKMQRDATGGRGRDRATCCSSPMPTSCTQPRCFVTALAEMERRELDFLSLFPLMKCVSLWENIILPSLVGGIAMFATPGIEDPGSPDALAAGAS